MPEDRGRGVGHIQTVQYLNRCVRKRLHLGHREGQLGTIVGLNGHNCTTTKSAKTGRTNLCHDVLCAINNIGRRNKIGVLVSELLQLGDSQRQNIVRRDLIRAIQDAGVRVCDLGLDRVRGI